MSSKTLTRDGQEQAGSGCLNSIKDASKRLGVMRAAGSTLSTHPQVSATEADRRLGIESKKRNSKRVTHKRLTRLRVESSQLTERAIVN